MFRSRGVLVKNPTYSNFTPLSWNGIPQPGITLANRWGSYSGIYRSQLWVSVLVNKIAISTARLPLKVYERAADGGRNDSDGAYAELLRHPSSILDPYSFWLWTVSTLNIYGEAFWLKNRPSQGAPPTELVPVHPTWMHHEEGRWHYRIGDVDTIVARRDIVHFKTYNPDTLYRGMSPLEPLRSTLENEEGARAANSALWRNGARPSVVLRHPSTITAPAQERLKANWEDVHRGAHNFAKTALLEEGMEAQVLSLNAEELQYIETRKLNREEVCAAFDVPPPVVHDLTKATFSNITEQMRSMYRDTMAPKLRLLESTLEMELRDGRFGADRDPDFGEQVYAEFLMDEVLRGSFEVRTPAMVQAINAGLLTPAEGRELENRPFIEGSDQLFINAAVVPIDKAGETVAPPDPTPPPEMEPAELEPADVDDDPVVRRHQLGIEARLHALQQENP